MYTKLIEELGDCWDYDAGFFGKLRQGIFDEDLYLRCLNLLRTISFDDNELIPKEIVSQLWYIPLFMEWQRDRIQGKLSPERFEFVKTAIENELERILGVP